MILDAVLNLIFPRRCVSCGRFGAYVCPVCAKKIEQIDRPKCAVCGKPLGLTGQTHPWCRDGIVPDGVTSFFRYRGPVRSLVMQIKYRGVSDMAVCLGWLMERTIGFARFAETSRGWKKPVLIVPLPIHLERKRSRGFNQSELIAREMEKRGIGNVDNSVLVRIRRTSPQVSMRGKYDRGMNVRYAFLVPGEKTDGLAGKTVVLVDDVMTTGSTVRSAVAALKTGGAGLVWVVTVAQ